MNSGERNFQRELGRRIVYARSTAKLSQEQLAKALGFKDRQTLSAVENGTRKLTAQELMALVRVTGRDMEFFMNHCQLAGEGEFSFRALHADEVRLQAFEQRAGCWLATYRRLGDALGEPRTAFSERLRVTAESSFEHARAAAADLSARWKLGETPATALAQKIEHEYHTLVLHVEADGISGAACHLEAFDTIFINRTECAGRRHFDLAHELFHLLTWEQMPPDREDADEPSGYRAKRREQLANNFASALLIPEAALRRLWNGRGKTDLSVWIARSAAHFHVTGEALKWRLMHFDWIGKSEKTQIEQTTPPSRTERRRAETLPALFSQRYMARMHKALLAGCISVRRAAEVLETDVPGLTRLFADHGFKPPFDL